MSLLARKLDFDEMTMELSEVANILGSTVTGNNCQIGHIAIDSRSLEKGDLYVALRGEHFDGHDFIQHAVEQGACAVIAENTVDCAVPYIVVKDTRLALGDIARHLREQFEGPLVGLTGSNGKTTVKEMLAAILEQKGPVLATAGNYNNDIGVPLTLFRLQSWHEYAVIEMGANHPGEIAYLTGIANPQVALITNAAAAHLEGFGSLDGVANAKGEIFSGLRQGGTAVINNDDVYCGLWKQLAADYNIITFGSDDSADVYAEWSESASGSEIDLHAPAGSVHVSLAMPGRHNVMNALASAAAAMAVGAGLQDVKAGLESSLTVPGRSQRKVGINGATVIDDTYNANPSSLNVALNLLSACPGMKLFVMGDMAELGDTTQACHRDAGDSALAAGLDGFYAFGPNSRLAVEQYNKGKGRNGMHFETQDALVDAVKGRLRPDVTVLVKGSRSMRMERVVASLTETGAD